jgi:nicotinamide mononucleotide transporter
LDALTNVLSVAAALLLTFRFREQWLCWIILDVFTVLMWAIRWYNGSPQGAIMVLMWSAYLVNAFFGWYYWSKNLREKIK